MTRTELLTTAKPILFNTEMVRAILDGRKTVTRRVIKPNYSNTHLEWRTDKYGTYFVEMQNDVEGETFGKNSDGSSWRKLRGYFEKKHPYQKGDILYVRETWHHNYFGMLYRADWPSDYCPEMDYDDKWCPSIHMPKEAARLFLRVTGVRVERVEDITVEQCEKEGMTEKQKFVLDKEEYWYWFRELWDSTIKKQDLDRYGWNANPWVWVIEFKRVCADEC